MKKIFLFFFFLFSFLFVPVFATDYTVNQLIPVNTSATVHTDKFDYLNFTFSSQLDSKGNGMLSFESIKNNTLSKTAVSINLLLFDESQKNIGFVTYCSNKDFDSEYSGFQLQGNQSSSFIIYVSPKYFVNGKSILDVRYVSVMDENQYCHVGGYTDYSGLTINEIVAKRGDIEQGPFAPYLKYFSFLQDANMLTYLMYASIIITVLFIFGLVLNSLHNIMYTKNSFLAYLPGFNFYISVKLDFIHIIFVLYFLLLVFSIAAFYYVKITYLLLFCGVVAAVSFFINIIKLISHNYDLFYFEPSVRLSNRDNNKSLDKPKAKTKKETKIKPLKKKNSNTVVNEEPSIEDNNSNNHKSHKLNDAFQSLNNVFTKDNRSSDNISVNENPIDLNYDFPEEKSVDISYKPHSENSFYGSNDDVKVEKPSENKSIDIDLNNDDDGDDSMFNDDDFFS